MRWDGRLCFFQLVTISATTIEKRREKRALKAALAEVYSLFPSLLYRGLVRAEHVFLNINFEIDVFSCSFTLLLWFYAS